MKTIHIVQGNILDAREDIILHQVNCHGVMGAGLAKAIRDRWPVVYEQYKDLCDSPFDNPRDVRPSPLLGNMQVVYTVPQRVGGKLQGKIVVNLFAQDAYGHNGCYTNYDALRQALTDVNTMFAGKAIAVPYKMSCGLAGGDWDTVLKILASTLTDCDIVIYRLG